MTSLQNRPFLKFNTPKNQIQIYPTIHYPFHLNFHKQKKKKKSVIETMDGIFGVIDDSIKLSIVDSTMMSIVHKAMDKAHERVKSKEGVIERLHEISKFYELSVMQLDGCIKFVQLETDSQNPEEEIRHREILSGLAEIRNRLHRRLHDSELAISQKDREFTDRFESESNLRQALEITERELVCSQEDLARSRSGESSNVDDENGEFCELKDSVDRQVWKIREKLDDFDGENGENGDDGVVRDSCVNDGGGGVVRVEEMGSDIDILKMTLDIAFGKMQSAIFCSEMGPIEQQMKSGVENDVVSICLKGFLRDSQVGFEEEKRNCVSMDEHWLDLMNGVAGLCEDLKPLVAQNGEDCNILDFGSCSQKRDGNTSQVDIDVDIDIDEHRMNNDERKLVDIDIDVDKMNSDEKEQVDIDSSLSKYRRNNDENDQVDIDIDIDRSFSEYEMNNDEDEQVDIDSSLSEYRMNNDEKDPVDVDIDIDKRFSVYRMNNNEKELEEMLQLRQEMLQDQKISLSSRRREKTHVSFRSRLQEVLKKLENLMVLNAKVNKISSQNGEEVDLTKNNRQKSNINETLADVWGKIHKQQDEENIGVQNQIYLLSQERNDREFQNKMIEEIYITLFQGLREKFCNDLSNWEMEILVSDDICKDFIRNQLNETMESYKIQAQIRDDILYHVVFKEAMKDYCSIYEFGLDGSEDTKDENCCVSSSQCLECKIRQENIGEQTTESILREEISWFLCLVLFKEKLEESNLETSIREEICYTVVNEAEREVIEVVENLVVSASFEIMDNSRNQKPEEIQCILKSLSDKVERTMKKKFHNKLFVEKLKCSLETMVSEQEKVCQISTVDENVADRKLSISEFPHILYDFELMTNKKLDAIMLRYCPHSPFFFW